MAKRSAKPPPCKASSALGLPAPGWATAFTKMASRPVGARPLAVQVTRERLSARAMLTDQQHRVHARGSTGEIGTRLLHRPALAGRRRHHHRHLTARHEALAPAFERAVQSGKPSIIHCFLDPEAISPTTTLTKIRNNAMRPKDWAISP